MSGSSAAPVVFAFLCGTTTVPRQMIVDGETGDVTLPVPAFLVVHERGVLVFDSGFNRRVHTDAEGDYVPAGFYDTHAFAFGPDDELAHQMRGAGFDPDDVQYVANSHLHYDHVGGNAQFPRATVILQEPEYAAGVRAPDEYPGYRKADFLTSQTKLLVHGAHDVFGDGAVVLVPTPGHTPGHQSLRVETAGRPTLLTADACYLERTLALSAVPGLMHDQTAFLASLELIRAFRASGGFVAYGHDDAFWARMPLAPAPLTPADLDPLGETHGTRADG